MDEIITNVIESAIDYKFKNKHLLQQALTRRSYSEEEGGENNEVLEFIGDKALDIVVIKILMERFGYITKGEYHEFNAKGIFKSKYDEGKLTQIKKELVEGKMLAKCITALGLNRYLIMGHGDAMNNIQEQDSVKEDLFEAIVGAVTIDSDWNLDVIEDVVRMMIDFDSYFSNSTNSIEYVGEIQKWCQRQNELPDYSFSNTNNGFKCRLHLEGMNETFYGEAKSKAEARMLAAKKAFEWLDKEDLLFSLEDEVGEPDIDRAINQLQELYQKAYIPEAIYNIYENEHSISNEDIWRCDAYLDGMFKYDVSFAFASSKKLAKKKAAYDLLLRVINNDADYYSSGISWDDEYDYEDE